MTARAQRPYALAVIPARAGSKGLPGKNLRPFAGRPMISWSVEAARASRLLSRTIVSTEDEAIAAAARAAGGEAPFTRPAELAQDDSSIVEVIRHAVTWHEKSGGPRPDLIVLLQPTSPLRRPEDIDECVRLVSEGGADSAQTVAEDHAHPWHRFLMKDGRLVPMRPEADGFSRRQEAPPVYRPTGSVYAAKYALVMEHGLLRGDDHRGLIRPFEVSVDVDDLWDFRLAELIAADAASR